MVIDKINNLEKYKTVNNEIETLIVWNERT